jgi:polar amino acid transport system substrate-binding protein
VVHIRVNAGAIPPENWVHDPRVGGGRLVGEGCHFIDLAIHLAGAPAVAVSATGIGGADPDAPLGDNVQVTLRCANGSLATIVYTSKGEPRAGKERVEVFAGGASAILDDFRRAEVWGESVARWKGTQDKGHAALMEAFMVCVRDGGPSPLTLETLENSSLASLVARRALVNDEVLPVAYTPGGEQVTPS